MIEFVENFTAANLKRISPSEREGSALGPWCEDLRVLNFKAVEFIAAGTAAADVKLREEISKRGVRAMIRETGLSQHTVEAVQSGSLVRPRTLALLRRGLRPK